ncbi:M23 family metallopeptidase [Alistipes sp.]|uniref:M23 family metallopeptidase n=1 Tax=Alistipes sp. TaxID=1872444 RepID=UPI003AF1A17B
MRKKAYFYKPLLLVLTVFAGCVRSDPEPTPDPPEDQPLSGLTVDEARAFFDSRTQQLTRSDGDDRPLSAFPVQEIVPDWSDSSPSQNERLACVDVAAETGSVFRILRRQPDGSMYQVRAYGKLLVVKSRQTDSLALYMRYIVPDRIYADAYDGDLSGLFANCDERCDYSGLEIYTTLDGAIAAVASYYEGELLGRIFMGDPEFSPAERDRRLRRLMKGVFIHPELMARTRMQVEWDFEGKQCFYDSTGALYYVVKIGGDYYATMDFDGVFPPCNNGRIGDDGGGGSSGGSTGGNTGPGGPGLPVGPGGPDGPGGGAGGGGGGGGSHNGNGDEDDGESEKGDDDEGDGNGKLPPRVIKDPYNLFNPPIFIDPIPYNPPDIPQDPKDPKEPEKPDDPEKKKPCADSLAMEANPLSEMKISDDNRSWKSNTWGYVRVDKNGNGRFHDGLDLKGVQGETHVYAMFGGTVIKIVSDQPMPDLDGNYPDDYSNDKNPAGNRITIETRLPDGRMIQVSYWHLEVKEKNEYTQKLFFGKEVKAGEIIGVVGRTGNAYNMKAHLHLKTYNVGTNKKEDSVNNPFLYLYTKFDPETGSVVRDC